MKKMISILMIVLILLAMVSTVAAQENVAGEVEEGDSGSIWVILRCLAGMLILGLLTWNHPGADYGCVMMPAFPHKKPPKKRDEFRW